MFRWAVELINALLDDTAPLANGNLSSSASLLARHGAELRREGFEEKFEKNNAELREFVRSRDLALAASAVSGAVASETTQTATPSLVSVSA